MKRIPIIYRPLQSVPKNRERQRSRFDSTWSATVDLLNKELMHLGARQAIIQMHCDESQIRNDGMPRSDARVISPAVAISFECKRGHLTYPCDTYSDWKDNIRAIALGLQALRAVDRHGITTNGQQYTGWKAITYRQISFDTSEQAARWLASLSFISARPSEIIADANVCKSVCSEAIKRLHPDTATGDAEEFQKALAARETLERYHSTLKIN